LLLDKIMFALKRAMNKNPNSANEKGDLVGNSALLGSRLSAESLADLFEANNNGNDSNGEKERVDDSSGVSPDLVGFAGVRHLSLHRSNDVAFLQGGLERRGNSHGKVYWRCYFNAVSCF